MFTRHKFPFKCCAAFDFFLTVTLLRPAFYCTVPRFPSLDLCFLFLVSEKFLKKLELLLVTPQETLSHFSFSLTFPCASYFDEARLRMNHC